jgi:acyl carrier protein
VSKLSIIERLQTELKNIIEIDNIDVEDNFFDIGGNSLLVMQFMDYVDENFSVELSIKDLFEKNILAIACLIEKQTADISA